MRSGGVGPMCADADGVGEAMMATTMTATTMAAIAVAVMVAIASAPAMPTAPAPARARTAAQLRGCCPINVTRRLRMASAVYRPSGQQRMAIQSSMSGRRSGSLAIDEQEVGSVGRPDRAGAGLGRAAALTGLGHEGGYEVGADCLLEQGERFGVAVAPAERAEALRAHRSCL